jgi:hypothetical protein
MPLTDLRAVRVLQENPMVDASRVAVAAASPMV